jgi:peptide/nickel transport system permease protein
MRNAVPGSPLPIPARSIPTTCLGGDSLARDVFSRAVMGSREVLKIAPFAAMISFMIGISLGLPAGYFGGRLDTGLTFLATSSSPFRSSCSSSCSSRPRSRRPRSPL